MPIERLRTRTHPLLICALLACCGASASGAAPGAGAIALDDNAPLASPTSLHLRSGEVSLAQRRDLRTAALEARRLGGSERSVIQLDGPMTPERREKLAAAGVTIGEYLPQHAYIARLEKADPDAAASLGFVRWAGSFDAGWKIDPEIGRRAYATAERQALAADGKALVSITLFADADVAETVALIEKINATNGAETVHRATLGGATVLAARIGLADVATLAGVEAVMFVEECAEITYRNGTNRWIVQSNVAGVTPVYSNGIHGEGQVLGHIDGRIDRNHCSFLDSVNPIGPSHRKILAYNATAGSDSHGTHTAATSVGDPGSDTDNRGVAYMGKLVHNIIPAFTEAAIYASLQTHHNQGGRLHTNSWGDDGTTAYTSMCRGVDLFSRDFEDSVVFFAVTNTSTLKTPENAKNCVAVGASQDTPNQGSFCSGGSGPTNDQRRKPELYAPGCGTISAANATPCGTRSLTGTSMASPAVTGAGMLVRQYYADGYYPTGAAEPSDAFTPSGALIRATMINSGTDMTGIAGFPSNQEGWGRVLLDSALYFPGDARRLVASDLRNAQGLSTTDTVDQIVNVVSSTEPLKVTLVWTDVAAAVSAGVAIVNDLDLEVISPGGTSYKGNVFAAGVSTTGGTKDSRNTVEQTLHVAPEAGPWTVRITAAAVNSGIQGYAIVVTGDVLLGPAPLTIVAASPPALVAPATPVDIDVTINPRDETLIGGSETLHYRFDPSDPFQTAPLMSVGGLAYEGTLPGASCGDTPQFYVSAESVEGGVKTSPPGAPTNLLSLSIGEVITLATDEFETLPGSWTIGTGIGDTATTGQWVQLNPNGSAAQPEDDHTPGAGVNCWVTGQAAVGAAVGTADVDNGFTTLFSQTLDLSAAPEARVGYWRWYSNSAGTSPNQDVFRVDVQNAVAGAWTNVETIGPSGLQTAGGWFYNEFRVADIIAPTASVRLRFVADDVAPGSIVEAAVDDFNVNFFQCIQPPPACPGDLTGDGQVGSDDLAQLLGAWGPLHEASPADLNGDGDVGSEDLALLLGGWGPCP